MNILHISDLHFGLGHWEGNNEALLEKLNSYPVDLVINTGDSTSDGHEREFKAARTFLKSIRSPRLVSIVGNHDKRSPDGTALFQKYLGEAEVVVPLRPADCRKKSLYQPPSVSGSEAFLSDSNFVTKVQVGEKCLLLVGLDSTVVSEDNGEVDQEMLRSLAKRVEGQNFDHIALLIHHSILDSDSDPLFNSGRVIKFVRELGIEHVFCGHTHKLSLSRSTNLYQRHSFIQYKNGSLSSGNIPFDANMFLFYEHFAASDMRIHIVRMFVEGEELRFEEEVLASPLG